jgi:hypothetical protein
VVCLCRGHKRVSSFEEDIAGNVKKWWRSRDDSNAQPSD